MSLAAGAFASGASGSERAPAPVLRAALEVYPADPDPDGTPAWLLHDPAGNRYFRLGPEAVDMLRFVDGRSAAEVSAATNRRFGHNLTAEDAGALFSFLRAHHLVEADAAQIESFRKRGLSQPGTISRLLRGYISFRVPLVRPDAFLTRTLPAVRWLGHPVMLGLLGLMALAGFWLAARQAEVFLATAVSFLSPQGAALYLAVLVGVKAAHELGHAYAAKAHGLRVPTIGVAFIVFWPIAYTDTTDAWKLTRRSARAKIAVAGIAVEMALAACALFFWNITPDGPLRDVLFVTATSIWLLSLIVNLNPLMRFDGYFLLADVLRMPNLEPRAHAMGRWKLRESLFGLGDTRPEIGRSWLIPYAYAIWAWRFVLFGSIALAVYLLFPKALGVPLAVIEIYYFIARPFFHEIGGWGKRLPEMSLNGITIRNLLLLLLVLALLLVPWRTRIHAPAIWVPDSAVLYASEGARIGMIAPAGSRVEANAPVIQLLNPALDHEIAQTRRRLSTLQLEAEALGVDNLRRARSLVVQAELQASRSALASLEQRRSRLSIEAPIHGRVDHEAPDLATGQWVAGDTALATVVGATSRLTAYVPETEVARLREGSRAWVVAEDGLRPPIAARIIDIAPDVTAALPSPLLASSHGGAIDVRRGDGGTYTPIRALYAVRLEPEDGQSSERALRTRAVFDASPQSIGAALWGRLTALLRRESGF